MLNEEKQKKELTKHMKRCEKILKQIKPTLPTTLPSLDELVENTKNVKNEDIANTLGLESPLLYVPVHAGDRLENTHSLDVHYMNEITMKTAVEITKIPKQNGVGGDRGLYSKQDIQQGELVLSDPPLLSISFGSHLCDHCGCPRPTLSSSNKGNKGRKGRSVPAVDGHADYCSTTCRDRAFAQYYAFMSSSDGEGMSQKYALLRSQYASAGTSSAPLIQSFHVLAALRICAITEQCKKRGELNPTQGTFDMPSFRCLLRPGDLGRTVLHKSGYRIPFNAQYRAYEKVRELIPSNVQKQANRYDMGWYDNIWGMLMMNCVNGGGVTATGEVTSVCLMRAGSFINHSTLNHNAILLPQRDEQNRLAFIAVRDIAVGEEISITYVDPSLETEEKIRLLATQYFIHEEEKEEEKEEKKEEEKEEDPIAKPSVKPQETSDVAAPAMIEIDASKTDGVIDADFDLEDRLLRERERLQVEVAELKKEGEELKKAVAAGE